MRCDVARARRSRVPAGPACRTAFWIGAPSSRLTGRATVVERLATPRKITSAPPPARTIRPIVPPGLHEQPDQEQHGADDRDDDAGDEPPAGAERGEADLGPHRRDRRDLRRPPGRHEHRQQRDADTDDRPTTMIVRGWSRSGVSGKPAPAALNSAMMPLATPSPPRMPSTVAVTEMISASSHDHASHLLRAGADGAHQRQLTQALADRDAEHVVDDERAHERR